MWCSKDTKKTRSARSRKMGGSLAPRVDKNCWPGTPSRVPCVHAHSYLEVWPSTPRWRSMRRRVGLGEGGHGRGGTGSCLAFGFPRAASNVRRLLVLGPFKTVTTRVGSSDLGSQMEKSPLADFASLLKLVEDVPEAPSGGMSVLKAFVCGCCKATRR